MATPHTGNPDGQNGASPAPAPGVVPIFTEPADGDDLNAASVNQAFSTGADFTAYIQSCARISPPIVGAANSTGFSSVTHTGGGTGTVVPSGTSNGGIFFVVQIDTSGGLNVGKYKYSINGGLTYSSAVTIPVSGVTAALGGVGIVLTFAGTFTATDTYAFRSADTPQHLYSDPNDSPLYRIDHLGFPGGNIGRFREDWQNKCANQTSTAAAITGNTKWAVTITNGSTISLGEVPSVLGSAVVNGPFAYGTLNTSVVSLLSFYYSGGTTPAGLLVNYDDTIMAWEWEIGIKDATVDHQWQFGLSNASGPAPSTVARFAWLKGVNGDRWICNVGTLAHGYGILFDTGVAATSAGANGPNMTFRIELYGANGPAGLMARFFINGVIVRETATNNVPQNNVMLLPYFYGSNLNSTVSSDMAICIGTVYGAWNRQRLVTAL